LYVYRRSDDCTSSQFIHCLLYVYRRSDDCTSSQFIITEDSRDNKEECTKKLQQNCIPQLLVESQFSTNRLTELSSCIVPHDGSPEEKHCDDLPEEVADIITSDTDEYATVTDCSTRTTDQCGTVTDSTTSANDECGTEAVNALTDASSDRTGFVMFCSYIHSFLTCL